MKHFKIVVSGRVQGVFYRVSAAEKARSLGLKGFVRNEQNGDVYIEAEGEENALKEYVAWCKVGPPAAKVDRCDVSEGALKSFVRFDIERY